MKEKGKIKKVEISKEEMNEGMEEYNKKQKWKKVTKTKQKRDKKQKKVKLNWGNLINELWQSRNIMSGFRFVARFLMILGE